MKRVREAFPALALALVLTMCFTGCSRNIRGYKAENEAGVILEVTKCETELKKNGYTVFNPTFVVTNTGSESVTSVSYAVDVLDGSGNVLCTVSGQYVHKEKPVETGDKATFSRGFQQVLDGKPVSLSLRITGYTDEQELPSPHVPRKGEYLFEAMQNPDLESIRENPPEKAEIVIDHGGAQETATVTDPAAISEIVDAFVKVKIGENTGEFVTDNYNSLSFTFADGTSARIDLNLKELEVNLNGEYYGFALDDFDTLWKIMNDLAE